MGYCPLSHANSTYTPEYISYVYYPPFLLHAFASQALHSFRRAADTNQRIEFDIDPSGAYLATGSTAREALVYDIQSLALIKTIDNQADAVSSVCFHPYAALLAVGTGQRHFNLDTINAESDSDEMLQDSASEGSNCCSKEVQNGVAIYRIRKTRGIVESKR